MAIRRSLLVAAALGMFAACGVAKEPAPSGSDVGAGGSPGGSGGEAGGAGGHAGGAGGSSTDTVEVPATVVGASGATLAGGSAAISVPAGALQSDVSLEVIQLGSDSVAGLPAASAPGIEGLAQLLDATFALLPHGTAFALPVSVELRHTGAGNVVLRLDDEHDTTWELIESATFSSGVARFEVQAFSIYAVATAQRECQRVACDALPEGLECGPVDDGCGSHVDLVADCGRPACGAGTSCDGTNRCVPDDCLSAFDCTTTTSECGIETDNCGTEHDVLLECANLPGCGALGACTANNRCGACTPFAGCAEALAAAGQGCHPQAADGCGGTMECAASVCEVGLSCIYILEPGAPDFFDCRTPCVADAECAVLVADYQGCIDASTAWMRGYSCEPGGWCDGWVSQHNCVDDSGNPTACVDGVCL